MQLLTNCFTVKTQVIRDGVCTKVSDSLHKDCSNLQDVSVTVCGLLESVCGLCNNLSYLDFHEQTQRSMFLTRRHKGQMEY